MGYIKTIVDLINKKLDDGFLSKKRFVNKSVIGIAQSMALKNDNGIQLLPCFIDENGESKYVGPEDDYDFSSYHKVNFIGVAKALVNKGFGDGKGYDANVVRMSFVVFGRRDKLQMTNDELALYIQVFFAEAAEAEMLKALQLKACNININDIILNDMQVFNEEFQGVEFFLKPEQFLLKVNYTIESAFEKKCFNICCE